MLGLQLAAHKTAVVAAAALGEEAVLWVAAVVQPAVFDLVVKVGSLGFLVVARQLLSLGDISYSCSFLADRSVGFLTNDPLHKRGCLNGTVQS